MLVTFECITHWNTLLQEKTKRYMILTIPAFLRIGKTDLIFHSDTKRKKQIVVDNTKAGEVMIPSFVYKDIGMESKFQTSAPAEPELIKKIEDYAKAGSQYWAIPPGCQIKITNLLLCRKPQ